jgi:hypothetical protein
MLVRDRGDSWQLVRQPDHADLSGQLAVAWGGNGFAPPSPRAPMTLAALRHDDGWGVFDWRPDWDAERGQPRYFLDVPVPVHHAFYRAGIAAITNEDRYAGMMVRMHAAGIYTGRYATQPSLGLSGRDEHRELIDAFVAEQEEAHRALAGELGAAEEERWTNYKLLQVYDRLSLYFCLKDAERGEADELGPVPRGANDVTLAIEPVGPWRVRVDPFPFAESPARFTLARRVLPKRDYDGNESFRRDFAAAPVEVADIVIEAP